MAPSTKETMGKWSQYSKMMDLKTLHSIEGVCYSSSHYMQDSWVYDSGLSLHHLRSFTDLRQWHSQERTCCGRQLGAWRGRGSPTSCCIFREWIQVHIQVSRESIGMVFCNTFHMSNWFLTGCFMCFYTKLVQSQKNVIMHFDSVSWRVTKLQRLQSVLIPSKWLLIAESQASDLDPRKTFKKDGGFGYFPWVSRIHDSPKNGKIICVFFWRTSDSINDPNSKHSTCFLHLFHLKFQVRLKS